MRGWFNGVVFARNVSVRTMFIMLLALSLVFASLLPGLHAFSDYFDRQPEDAQLNRWMEEQLGQSQEMV